MSRSRRTVFRVQAPAVGGSPPRRGETTDFCDFRESSVARIFLAASMFGADTDFVLFLLRETLGRAAPVCDAPNWATRAWEYLMLLDALSA